MIEWLACNGSASTAHDTRNFALSKELLVCTTAAQSPGNNGIAAGFVKIFKRDDVHVNCLENAKVVPERLPGWIKGCNEIAPNKSLKKKSLKEDRKS